jgi:hypothetical protein
MQLEGGKELEIILLRLESKTSKVIVRRAVNKGLRPVRKAARENVKTMMGGDKKSKDDFSMRRLLAKNIIIKPARRQRSGSYLVRVQIRSGIVEFVYMTEDGTEYYIPAAIEFGHDDVPAIPFMRKAADEVLKTKSKSIVAEEIRKGIQAVARGGR